MLLLPLSLLVGRLMWLLLLPFSLIYGAIIWARGKLYDLRILRSHSAPLPTIGVGNLAVGGTGKSPMVGELAEMLRGAHHPAVLSRGYGRRTRGFREVLATSTAAEVGDEPLQLKLRHPWLRVVVCEDRVRGCETIRERFGEVDVILLDDAYQHRRLRVGLELLLTSYTRLYTRDWPMPLGRLRDLRNQAKRARAIVLTKCPTTLTDGEREALRRELTHPGQTFVCSGIAYGTPRSLYPEGGDEIPPGAEVSLITAIANPHPLWEYVAGEWCLRERLSLRDHARFGERERQWMQQEMDAGRWIVSTEKDAMRLRDAVGADEQLAGRIFYIPIRPSWFGDDAERVKTLVYEYLAENR
ncbi:MAG: tetraacyldisaccharide 4'-kinase [Bacteroidia bacterium]|nr:MAG: tetraacyldisaccharide 4'-kinase [Bacteroidia bacterium]